MALTLTIPDDVLVTIKLPKARVETELRKEVAFALYESRTMKYQIHFVQVLPLRSPYDFLFHRFNPRPKSPSRPRAKRNRVVGSGIT